MPKSRSPFVLAFTAVVLLLSLLPLIDGREVYQARFCRDLLHLLLVIQGLLLAWTAPPSLSDGSPSFPRPFSFRGAASSSLANAVISGVTGLLSLGFLQLLTGATQLPALLGVLLLSLQTAILTAVQFATRSRLHPVPASLLTLLIFVLGSRQDLPLVPAVFLPDFSAYATRSSLVFELSPDAASFTTLLIHSYLYIVFYFSLSFFPGRLETPAGNVIGIRKTVPALFLLLAALLLIPSVNGSARRFTSNLLWLVASEYHHAEPSRAIAAVFPPGTASRIELIPPLRAALRCDPAQTESRLLLGSILLSNAGSLCDGTAVLEEGMRLAGSATEAHRFPATLALAALERHRHDAAAPFDANQVLSWLDRAMQLAPASSPPPTPSEVFHPARYHQLRAVVLIGLKRLDEAVTAWEASGEPIASSPDLAALYLSRYRNGIPLPSSPADLRPIPYRHSPETGSQATRSETASSGREDLADSIGEEPRPAEPDHDTVPSPGGSASRQPVRLLFVALLTVLILTARSRGRIGKNLSGHG
ncbi:MAG TPA: hypothetical protein VIV61_14400 [Candidatus Ozemobacteraceae bacterium]